MNLTELLKELGIPYAEAGSHEHVTPGWIGIDCGYCSPGWQHYRLGINEQYLNTSCWSCGPHSLLSVLLQLCPDRNYGELKDLLKGVPRQTVHEGRRVLGKFVAPEGIGRLTTYHEAYLHKRGFESVKPLIKLWDIAGFSVHSRYSWRIYIPIFLRGQQVSFTTRTIKDKGLRYLSCDKKNEAYPHRQLLYGEDYARDAILIVEGPLDVWKIGPGAVCTFGTSFTKGQILRMVKYPTRVVCFDKEPQAQWQANKLASALEGFPGKTYVVTLNKKDPAESTEAEILKLRKTFLGEGSYGSRTPNQPKCSI